MQDVIDEYQGADTAEAERKDSHAAERLLAEGLLNWMPEPRLGVPL